MSEGVFMKVAIKRNSMKYSLICDKTISTKVGKSLTFNIILEIKKGNILGHAKFSEH